MAKKKLSYKQKRFVAAYCGNIREAAEASGLTYDYCRALVHKPHVKQAIRDRYDREADKHDSVIASRHERQEFWTKTMLDPEKEMKDRLRASELLGRSEKDFTDKVEQSGPNGLPLETDIQITFVKPGELKEEE